MKRNVAWSVMTISQLDDVIGMLEVELRSLVEAGATPAVIKIQSAIANVSLAIESIKMMEVDTQREGQWTPVG